LVGSEALIATLVRIPVGCNDVAAQAQSAAEPCHFVQEPCTNEVHVPVVGGSGWGKVAVCDSKRCKARQPYPDSQATTRKSADDLDTQGRIERYDGDAATLATRARAVPESSAVEATDPTERAEEDGIEYSELLHTHQVDPVGRAERKDVFVAIGKASYVPAREADAINASLWERLERRGGSLCSDWGQCCVTRWWIVA
jgi:hypothetical protein